MGVLAARQAIGKAAIDPETLDYIVVAHNWGDVDLHHNFYDLVPNIAARIKHRLGIRRSACVAYDVLFGCPGWLQGFIQADCFIRAGMARRALIVGSDTVSRVADPHDRDSMLFSDGAGAIVVEGVDTEAQVGALHHATISDCGEELGYLNMGRSFNPDKNSEGLYLKMQGRNVFRYALEKIPPLVRASLQACGVEQKEVKKILMHQANKKMIEMITRKLFPDKDGVDFLASLLPINVNQVGNNSVATIPVLLHEILMGDFPGHIIHPGDVVVFASVGAGMHANCMVYRF
jgi:3-oxoacyl-[acyl-carrier-protein] synthase-3